MDYGFDTAFAHIESMQPSRFRSSLRSMLLVYAYAMNYSYELAMEQGPKWFSQTTLDGWNCQVARTPDGDIVGFTYGYSMAAGQWWYEQVAGGMREAGLGEEAISRWLSNGFELAELHVQPNFHGKGVGLALVTELLARVAAKTVVLSTLSGPSRARALYERLAFQPLLDKYYFSGDERTFSVLARDLPLSRDTRCSAAGCPARLVSDGPATGLADA